jgi:hypothetical protein
MSSRNILTLAAVLILIWIIASVTKFIVGTAIHLLLVLAVILLVIGLLRRLRS